MGVEVMKTISEWALYDEPRDSSGSKIGEIMVFGRTMA